MKTSEINLNPYKITWAEFFPESGIVTKHDMKAFGDILLMHTGQKSYRKHFPTKEAAIAYINGFSAKLDKSYKVLLFTDKQFSMTKRENGYAIPYTRKQLQEVYHIN